MISRFMSADELLAFASNFYLYEGQSYPASTRSRTILHVTLNDVWRYMMYAHLFKELEYRSTGINNADFRCRILGHALNPATMSYINDIEYKLDFAALAYCEAITCYDPYHGFTKEVDYFGIKIKTDIIDSIFGLSQYGIPPYMIDMATCLRFNLTGKARVIWSILSYPSPLYIYKKYLNRRSTIYSPQSKKKNILINTRYDDAFGGDILNMVTIQKFKKAWEEGVK